MSSTKQEDYKEMSFVMANRLNDIKDLYKRGIYCEQQYRNKRERILRRGDLNA